jgi:hypothetical protein
MSATFDVRGQEVVLSPGEMFEVQVPGSSAY